MMSQIGVPFNYGDIHVAREDVLTLHDGEYIGDVVIGFFFE